ncbi:CG34298, partial [Drosophila busckii]
FPNPICEPFTNLPQKFDIDKIAEEFKPKHLEKSVEKIKTPRDFLNEPDNSWTVLPIFKYHLEHLKPLLSVRTNPYMRCRYVEFLDNVPNRYVNIVVYGTDFNNMPKPRRKSLNGQFYGVDYKLAPIPVEPASFSYSA